jgi:hypothetical protein
MLQECERGHGRGEQGVRVQQRQKKEEKKEKKGERQKERMKEIIEINWPSLFSSSKNVRL